MIINDGSMMPVVLTVSFRTAGPVARPQETQRCGCRSFWCGTTITPSRSTSAACTFFWVCPRKT